jgi:phosphate transport system substrate-binding protein
VKNAISRHGLPRMGRRTMLCALALLASPLAGGLSGCAPRAMPEPESSDFVESAPPALVPSDPEYSPYPTFGADPNLSGTVRSVGSSAVGLVLNSVRPLFREEQPEVELRVLSPGSADAPKALASGESDIAPMSRFMTAAEIASIETAQGRRVQHVDIAIDAIAFIVHRSNPLTRISLRDLDRMYGRDRKRGGAAITRWGEVGASDASGAPLSRAIVLHGMSAKSGSNGIVREVVLQGGAFRTSVNEEPVSSSIVQAVATDPWSIGYCSAYFTSEVFKVERIRVLEVETLDGSAYLIPTDETVRSDRYPLSRRLRIYFLEDLPTRNPAAAQLLRFLLSDDGQEFVRDLGQRTLSPAQAHAEFAKLAPKP